jgi:hypothetical protein
MHAILHLPLVIYGCTVVTYGSRERDRKSRAPQPCPATAAAIRSSTRRGRADGMGLRCLSASSISLSAAGPAFEATRSYRRHQGRLHREALPRVGTTSALVRQHDGSIAKRDRQPGVAGGTEAETKAWLSEFHAIARLFSWNIDSIVCSSRNWSKPINCWCPRYVGQLDQRD